jgi:hypothetical protein
MLIIFTAYASIHVRVILPPSEPGTLHINLALMKLKCLSFLF